MSVAEQIKKELFDGDDYIEVETETRENGELSITVSNMYEYVKFPLSTLLEIRRITGMENVDIDDMDCSSGCESCDYGSKYVVTLLAYN